MIEPWQVWLADLNPTEDHEHPGQRPVITISSDLAIRVGVGRLVTVVPVTTTHRRLNYHIPITTPKGDTSYAMTDQTRTISTHRFVRSNPWWTLTHDEITDLRRALSFMLDLT
jgi:mRNA-degrading endonuclease toxin of MazEF toxin-antitoxin module